MRYTKENHFTPQLNRMYHIDQLKHVLRVMAETDMTTMPSPRFKGFVRELLISQERFSAENAETIAARMVVELGKNPMDDEDLRELALSYAKLIGKMRQAYCDTGFQSAEMAVVESASQLTLQLS